MSAYAIRKPDGTYYVSSDRPSDTYYMRERIKQAGGHWDGRHWNVTEEQRIALGVERKVAVIGKGCHPPMRALVLESKAIKGNVVDCYCDQCDGRTNMTITAVKVNAT